MVNLKAKFLKALLIAVPILLLVSLIYVAGRNDGSALTQGKWDKEKRQTNEKVMDLIVKNATNEQAHRNEAARISDELESSNAKYAEDIALIRADYDKRLRESTERASVYQRLSKAGPAKQERLAGYATELDTSLAEGRQLVKEFRTSIEQRDREVKLLGAQIIADRNLIGQNDVPSAK